MERQNKGGYRGGGSSNRGRGGYSGGRDDRKKEPILDLSKYLDKAIRVKFSGGREVYGILKGYDPLLNLVLDDTHEYLRDPEDTSKVTDKTRELGLVVCRTTTVIIISPVDGTEEIANPYV
ncbi:Sm-like protein lsm7 [Nowakowskiella sp. JEL0407]|nr:Sm-like protein lsm7 [Nowakowskiella sp. JEL0407]